LNPRPLPCQGLRISEDKLNEYLEIIKLKGISEPHQKLVKTYLTRYLKKVNSKIDKKTTIAYFNLIRGKYSVSSYRKEAYQLLKFLRFLKVDWIDEIQLPPEPFTKLIRVTKDDIEKSLQYFKNKPHYLRYKALILLGGSSGLRAEEIYQLNINDIDLNNRLVHVNHNPKLNQTTKTKRSRTTFFDERARNALKEYFEYFNNGGGLRELFPQKRIERNFQKTTIQVKYLRKYFSQEWDRRGGPTSIKKILMGHSLKGDVDLMHYNAQSPEDLKRIYDKVMCRD
jgi:integrase/recombinase XerD